MSFTSYYVDRSCNCNERYNDYVDEMYTTITSGTPCYKVFGDDFIKNGDDRPVHTICVDNAFKGCVIGTDEFDNYFKDLMYINANGVFGGIRSDESYSESKPYKIDLQKLKYIEGNNSFSGIQVSEFNLPSLEYIVGNNTFGMDDGCINLKYASPYTFNLPNLKTIHGSFTFSYSNLNNSDYLLKSIDLPSLEYIMDGFHTFNGLQALESLNLPKLKEIGGTLYGSLFGECDSLTKLDLPSLEKSEGGLSSIKNLSEINVPKLKEINWGDFSFLKKLKKLELPSIEYVIRTDFGDNDELEYIRFGPNLKMIGRCVCDTEDGPVYPFYNSPKLKYLQFDSVEPPILSYEGYFDEFTSILRNNGTIVVPAESVEKYKTATNWSRYKDKISSEIPS